MRNLKRALSLILAAAMLIGMMVVGAGAVSYNDFPDRDEIVNKDAVSMLTTLGIIEGTDQGTYNPTGDVDRAQMAKMISVALTNNENCDTLYQNVDSGLTDIAANWARGYINYCYTLGIIAGRGNNTFDPSANVTGVEAAKMLLAALGYDAEIEGLVGTDWALNTAALAQNLGIFRNFTKDVSEPLNRDDAALLIYNALDVELIQEYRNGYAISYDDHRTILSSVFGVIRVEGVVAANEWAQLQETNSAAALREGRTTLENVVWYDSTTANTVVEEGVRETEPVTFNYSTSVDLIGKAVTLYVEKTTILANSKVLGIASNDNMNVINTTVENQGTVADYLDGTGVTVDEDTEYYVNYGYFNSEDAAIDWINEYYHTETPDDDFNLNGIEVEVIDNNDDGIAEYVLYLQETLSEINRYNERNETVSFYTPDRDSRDDLDGTHSTLTVDMANVVADENVAFEAEELVLYVQYGGRTYLSAPEIVTGTMARIDRDRDNELYITVNDTQYYQSYILDAASLVDVDVTRFIIDEARTAVGFDTTYDFILDSNGYVVAFRPAEEIVTNYALVLDSAWTQNALRRGGQVKILMADGTENTYDINWDDSADAFNDIIQIRTRTFTAPSSGTASDSKLEYYLGSRDVVQDVDGNRVPGAYSTGNAAGSVIEYSLNEAGDELTIERVLQGNNLVADTASLEIADNVNTATTAGVADNGYVIYLDGNPNNHSNLQYVAPNGYDNGYGRLTVSGSALDDTEDMYLRQNVTKNYAVDMNTVAFYWLDKDNDGAVDSGEYGVATGWDVMSDVENGTDVQVYPVLDKTTNRTYKASNLADVILFEAEPNTIAADYMLVLSANAVGKDLLELNVVFEDGTVEAITVDDEGSFNEENPNHFMKAWTYSENADGTYDIGVMGNDWGTADLLIEGTIDLNDGNYLALPSSAAVWDVTEADNADDEVTTGRFLQNNYVNTAVVVSEGQVRTAWIWDLDDDQTIGSGFNFNWNTDGFQTVYAYNSTWGQYQIQEALSNNQNVRVIGNLELQGTLYIPDGLIVQVEGNLDEHGYSVAGGGTMRVRGDYLVNNNGATDGTNNSRITVSTQVGGDLLLSETTSTASRIGVAGDVIGNTTNSDVAGDVNHRFYDLTVDSASGLYVTGDVEVRDLTVNGHIEANHYHIRNGVVNSTRTLIALGNISVYGGTLTIGGTSAGSATVNGNIASGMGYTGHLNVNNGTLTLTRSASIGTTANPIGNVTVGTNGVISQPNGVTHNLVSTGTVTINGTVSIPGTIVAPSVVMGTGSSLTVTSTPANLSGNTSGLIIVGGGTNVPAPSSNWLSGVEVNDVAVTMNHTARTGSVVLMSGKTAITADTVDYTLSADATAYPVTVMLNNRTMPTSGTLESDDVIRIDVAGPDGSVQTYQITVIVRSAYSVTVSATGATVSGVTNGGNVPALTDVTFTVTPDRGYTVSPDAVTYTVTTTTGTGDAATTTQPQAAENLGNNTYRIPGARVTGSIEISVRGVLTPVRANVRLGLATDYEDVATISSTSTDGSNYEVLVESLPANLDDAVAYLRVVNGNGTTDTDLSDGNYAYKVTEDTSRFTVTFAGKNAPAGSTAYDQTVTVTFRQIDAAEMLSLDKAAVETALRNMSINTGNNWSASDRLVSDIQTELGLLGFWGTTIDVTDATIPGSWNTNETGPVEVSVTVSLENGEETATISGTFTMTLGPNA